MAIKLRVNQATALTYNEMDRNFSSLFYSASVDTTTNHLHLWYTGSSALNSSGENYEPHSVPINLQPTTGATPTLVVAQPIRGLQYNDNGTQLGASSELVYSTDGYLGVGVGVPVKKLHIRGNNNTPATLRLESIGTLDNINRKSTVEFYQGTKYYGSVGRDNYTDSNLYIRTHEGIQSFFEDSNTAPGNLIINIGNSATSAAFTPTGLGIGILIPSKQLHVVGEGYFTGKLGVGTVSNGEALNVFQNTQLQATSGIKVDIAKFGIIPLSSINTLNITAARTSAGSDWTTSGMRLQQQVDNTYMSYLQFSGDGNDFGISIGTGGADTAQIGVNYNDVPEVFRIDAGGNVGINTKTSTEKLTVKGNISGSGFVKVDGNATIGGALTTGGTATIGTVSAGNSAYTSAVVISNVGLVQKLDAAPIPKGGIILWSGATGTIPAGWRLCDGGSINGMATPNLQDKFVVGAGSGYAVEATGGYANAVVVSHTHTGNTNHAGAHNHLMVSTVNQVGLTANTAIKEGASYGGNTSYSLAGGNSPATLGATSTVNTHIHSFTTNTATNGESGTNKNLPPYYALAYIMYGGVA
jgi:hypothetical protein